MANSTTNLDTLPTDVADKAPPANSLFDAASPATLFGRRASTTAALSWGFYGGMILVDGVQTSIANGTIALTASTTNYMEATRAGVVSVNTTGFTAGQIPLYTVVTGAAAVTSYTDYRAWVQPLHVHGKLARAMASDANITLTAAEARNHILEFTSSVSLTARRDIVLPLVPQQWTVFNDTTGGQGLRFIGASGTGVVVPNGHRTIIYSDGTNVVRADNNAINISKWAVPSGISPSGTMANNGAVTLGTALNRVYSEGIWLYFPAGAISAGSAAGSYWCKFSSTTVGTVYNTTLGTNAPYIPASDVAFVTTGPGAYTGATTEITLATVNLPGGLMGSSGQIVLDGRFVYSNSANTKTLKMLFGGTQVLISLPTTSVTLPTRRIVANITESFQDIGPSAGNTPDPAGVSPIADATATVNTASDVSLTWTGQLAVATDFVILVMGAAEVRPS